MLAAIKQQVTVQPGGVVGVRSPELTPGATVEVITLIEQPAGDPPPASFARTSGSFIGSATGQFKSAEDVDAYVRELRDEWER